MTASTTERSRRSGPSAVAYIGWTKQRFVHTPSARAEADGAEELAADVRLRSRDGDMVEIFRPETGVGEAPGGGEVGKPAQ